MRFDHTAPCHGRGARAARFRLLGAGVVAATFIAAALSLVGVAPAVAASGLTVPAQSPPAVLPTGTATYSPIVWSGGTPGDFVSLAATGLPSGAAFVDTGDGCATETGSGTGNGTFSFTQADVTTTSGIALGSYTFTVTATEYATSGCTGAVSTAVGTFSLAVSFTPTVTVAAPSVATTGTLIPVNSVSAVLVSGDTNPAITGTISYTVFGPQATAPVSCTSGGTAVATTTVSGNGTYLPSTGFSPGLVGDYWWYASYGGDTNDIGTTSTCGANMPETVVAQGAPVISWTAPASITYGTSLGAAQLDATIGVAGTLAYTPSAGAVLGVGTTTLSVVFTPSDGVDYAASSATVSLTVNPAPLQITAASTTMGHGESPAAVSPSYAGFVNGDGPSSLTVPPTCTTSATSATAVGTDAGANTCSGAVEPNYSISYTPGNVTVIAPLVTNNSKSLSLRSDKKMTVALSCASAPCKGTISISYRPGTRILGEDSYSLALGTKANQTLTLNSTGRHRLATVSKAHPLRVVMKITLSAGLTHEQTIKVT